MNYLTNIDLNKNQILNYVVQKLATAPSPEEAFLYYNTTDHTLYYHNGTTWIRADGLGATMTGDSIVISINGSSALIDDDNLSQGVRDAIAQKHNSHTIATVSGLQTALDGKVDDSQVLTNVPAEAKFTDTIYTHPTTSGNNHIPSGGSSGQFLKWNADGAAVWAADNNTVYTHPTGDGDKHVPATGINNDGKVLKAGATAGTFGWAAETDTITSINGKTGVIAKADIVALGIPAQDTTYGVFTTVANGLVPLGGAGTTKYLRQDGTWVIPPNDNTVYTHPTGAGNLHIPTGGTVGQILKNTASGTATWQNEYSYTHPATHTIAEVSGLQTALNDKETPTGAQNKATTAENNAKAYADTQITALVASSPAALDTLNELAAALGNDPNFATTMTNLLTAKTNKYSVAIGGSTSVVVTHNLNTRDAAVMIRQTASPYAQVYTDVEMTTVNTATIKFAVAPTAGQYTVTIIG